MNNRNSIKFSFIVPVYNVEKYIQECVDSLILQDYQNYEIILVDDGSTDKSGFICDELAQNDERIVVIHKSNGGLSDARNFGIQRASGDYVLFVDGDDMIFPYALSSIVETICVSDYPDVVFLECIKFFEDSEKRIFMNDGVCENISTLRDEELHLYLSQLNKYPASACTKAIKLQFIKENELFFEKELISEDLEWAVRLFLNVKTAAYCKKKYYLYRLGRNGSISNTHNEKKVMDITNTFCKWIDYSFENPDISDVDKRMIRSFMEYVLRLILLYYHVLSKENAKVVCEKIQYRKKYLGVRDDMISKVIYVSFLMLGIKGTNALLVFAIKMRTILHC